MHCLARKVFFAGMVIWITERKHEQVTMLFGWRYSIPLAKWIRFEKELLWLQRFELLLLIDHRPSFSFFSNVTTIHTLTAKRHRKISLPVERDNATITTQSR